ncbi:MAG: glycosyltransferase family 39 protein [Bryobacterales bacterium]
MSDRWISITRWAAPAAFLLASCLWIDRPGPGPDEALFAQALFPAPPGGPAWRVTLFGHEIPVMLMTYLGALKAWLYVPVVRLFGTGPAALRLPMLAAGALTILVLFEWIRRWSGGLAAVWTSWLLALDPTFVWTTRCDWGPVALQRLLSVGGCALIWNWSRNGGWSRLFAGFFLFGLGLFDKLTFHWLLLAYAVAALAIGGRWALRQMRPTAIAIALAGFALGAAPYLAYRVQGGGLTQPLELETRSEGYWQKWGMLLKTFEGTAARGFMIAWTAPASDGEEPPVHGSTASLLPWAALASLLLLPWTQDKPARFAAVVSAVALAEMVPIRDAGAVHHQALIWPYPQLLVGATVAYYASRQGRRRRVALGAAGALLLSNIATLASLYQDALRLGGTVAWSEAAYSLADDLTERRPRWAVSLDWGLDNPQRFLLAHDPPVQPLAFPWDWADRGTVEQLEHRIRQGGVVFLALADQPREPTETRARPL